ncbi:MAG TPA: hypothetical protein VMT81_00580 [Candidatus Paceibacterota bacterium]|nr:hypothetical protein [Candidatus Paceibacterota bacterium]
MAEGEDSRMERVIRYVLGALAVVLIVLFIFLFLQYRALWRQQAINTRELRLSQFLEKHGPLAPGDASAVRVWMTFDYINKLFALPPEYLQDQLQIADTHYPRITVAGYAASLQVLPAVFLDEVENAVRSYSAPGGAATSTSV